MAYTRLTDDLDVIQKLDNEPNDVGGLSADELKAKFDEPGNLIKQYLNSVLLPEIEGEDGADNIGVNVPGLTGITDLASALARIVELMQEITQGAVADGSVTTVKLADLAVATAKIAGLAVTQEKLAADAVSTAKIVDLAVTAAKLAADAVETAKIKDSAVTTAKIADNAITNAKMADASIGTAEIDSYAVTEPKMAAGAVSARTIQSGAVSTSYNGTINVADWSGNAAPYSAAIAVSGMLAADKPVVDLVLSGTYSTDEALVEAWGKVYRAVAAVNTLTFYAKEKPEVALPFTALCVRK